MNKFSEAITNYAMFTGLIPCTRYKACMFNAARYRTCLVHAAPYFGEPQ
jgi:hypothetical protein